MKTMLRSAGLAALAIGAGSCAVTHDATQGGSAAATEQAAVALMKKDFKPRGQATLARLDQDEVQKACTEYAKSGRVPVEVARKLEAGQAETIRYPADGHYLGDWKAGEKIAQTGVGKQWSDNPAKPAGGNCYACHQLSQAELSYGTVGPSLYHFGRKRGFTPEMQRYVFGKVYNPEAFAACSSMPRFGHMGILTEQQIKDVVALIMDPKSPVNQ